jgi:hypothetical protein
MVSIMAACSRTHFASSAVASRATAINANSSNFFIIEWPPARPQFDVKPLQQGSGAPNQSNCRRRTALGLPRSRVGPVDATISKLD